MLAQIGEPATNGKYPRYCRDVTDGVRRADFGCETTARLFMGIEYGNGLCHALNGAVMQRVHQLIRLDRICRKESALDVVGERLGFGWHQIAVDPLPDRIERHPRQSAEPLMIGGAIDQKRCERHEEASRHVVCARRGLAAAAAS